METTAQNSFPQKEDKKKNASPKGSSTGKPSSPAYRPWTPKNPNAKVGQNPTTSSKPKSDATKPAWVRKVGGEIRESTVRVTADNKVIPSTLPPASKPVKAWVPKPARYSQAPGAKTTPAPIATQRPQLSKPFSRPLPKPGLKPNAPRWESKPDLAFKGAKKSFEQKEGNRREENNRNGQEKKDNKDRINWAQALVSYTEEPVSVVVKTPELLALESLKRKPTAKDVAVLKTFLDPFGKIKPRVETGVSVQQQHAVAKLIRRYRDGRPSNVDISL